MNNGTFTGTIGELERLSRRTGGRLVYVDGARVTNLTRVFVDPDGNVFSTAGPRHKAGVLAKCYPLAIPMGDPR